VTDNLNNFDDLYPGRFLKAGNFATGPGTLTIRAVRREEIEGDKGAEMKVLLSFAECEQDMVLAKVNGIAIRAMFGGDVANWIGKRVAFYATSEIMPFPGKREPCIRVFGSPDIVEDVRCEWQPPKRKLLVQTLLAMPSPEESASAATVRQGLERIAGARSQDDLGIAALRADELLRERHITAADRATLAEAITQRQGELIAASSAAASKQQRPAA